MKRTDDFQSRAVFLNDLSPLSLKIDMEGKWYTEQAIRLAGPGFPLETNLHLLYGMGPTPEDAVGDLWRLINLLPIGWRIALPKGDFSGWLFYRWDPIVGWKEESL